MKYSWLQFYRTVKKIKSLSHCAFFLLLWFIYSDGFNSILHTAVLFVNSEIDGGCLGTDMILCV